MAKFKEPIFEGHNKQEISNDAKTFLSNSERELTPEELKERLRDPNILPTHEQITKAFIDWGDLRGFCFDKENKVFEFFNEEYLNAFADYFVSRINEYSANKERPLIILEIGAGNGRLSHFLEQKLEERIPKQTKVIATDSDTWALKKDFPVEQLKHDEAMKKYNPDIVIFSWMPYREDSSKDIRKVKSVQEYILIGETDEGCCGDEWETWGQSWAMDEDYEGEKTPLYELDGFKRENLDDLSELQICRTDDPGDYFHSRTVSFKRK